MFETLINAIKIDYIRKKIIFTLLILIIVRFGSYIPIPGINLTTLKQIFSNNGILDIIDTFSGGSLSRFTIFAMSIVPYINASILMTLLAAAFEYLKTLAKEDNKKIAKITRYLTLFLSIIQSIGLTIFINMSNGFSNSNLFSWIICILTMTAGTMLLMWLGELIDEYGIGNGISLIIFIGIISRIPYLINTVHKQIIDGSTKTYMGIILIITIIITIVGIIIVQQAERRITVHYAKRVIGRKMYGGQSTFIPIKLNQAGVIPIIFASSILILPGTIISIFFNNTDFYYFFQQWFGVNTPIYILIYAALIILFTFFYSIVAFNTSDVTDNLKKNGGFIPGIRPGKSTTEVLQKILIRITLFGAIFLALIALFPNILGGLIGGVKLQFGGTSLLIAVGVAIDTMKQMESQLLMQHYKGFLK